jgi:hypothetical protein
MHERQQIQAQPYSPRVRKTALPGHFSPQVWIGASSPAGRRIDLA